MLVHNKHLSFNMHGTNIRVKDFYYSSFLLSFNHKLKTSHKNNVCLHLPAW